MNRSVLVELTNTDREQLWTFMSDRDIAIGSDGKEYIYEKALKWYYMCKQELGVHINEVERGAFPTD